MKKNLQLLALFLGLTLVSFAQMKQGKITYDMTFASDDPAMAMGVQMMNGSKMSLSFMPGKSRSDVSMGMMGTMATISDEKSKKVLSLMDMMGMKYAIESTTDEEETAGEQQKPEIEITKETKEIMGYKCKKAIMTVETEEGPQPMIMWFTEDISVFTGGQSYYNEDMPGFPMEMSITQGGMNVNLVVTSIDKKVDKSLFDMSIPEGYEVKTNEELRSMGGGQ